MAYDTVKELFTGIAGAVREKSEVSDTIDRKDLPEKIEKLAAGSYVVENLSGSFAWETPIELLDHMRSGESTIKNLEFMFRCNSNIKEVDFTKYPKLLFGTGSGGGSIFSKAFYGSNIEKVDMRFHLKEGYDIWANGTSSVGGICNYARALKEIIFPEFKYKGSASFNSMFSSCTSLESADLTKLFSGLYKSDLSSAFYYCKSLKKVWIPSIAISSCTVISKSIFKSVGGTDIYPEDLVIYTDFPDLDSADNNLGKYWRYAGSSNPIPESQIRFGATHEEYLAAPPTEGGAR